ncbi:MAG: site-2 protease family protein [Bacteroidia bacterium]|nr:site-2 protease family protein [Bacteroidia bacterium]
MKSFFNFLGRLSDSLVNLNLRIGRFGKAPIRIHWTFLLLLALLLVDPLIHSKKTWSVAIFHFFLYVGVTLSVILHEVGHALAARAFHIPTLSITMYPFGGVAQLATISRIPKQELIITIAGPVANFILVGIFAIPLWIEHNFINVTPKAFEHIYKGEMPTLDDVMSLMIILNLAMAVFNLLPAFPMDGGRILRSLLAQHFSYKYATWVAAGIGKAFALLFFVVGFAIGRWILVAIGAFVFLGALSEGILDPLLLAPGTEDYRKIPVEKVVMRGYPTLSPEQSLRDAVRAILDTQAHSFLIVNAEGKPLGSLSRHDVVVAVGKEVIPLKPVEEIMDKELIYVAPSQSLRECMRLIEQKDKPFAVVRDEKGEVMGIVDRDNITEFMLVGKALGKSYEEVIAEAIIKAAPSLASEEENPSDKDTQEEKAQQV